MDSCNLGSRIFNIDIVEQAFFLFLTWILIGMVMAAAACIILRRRIEMYMTLWHPAQYPIATEECAKVRGVLVTCSSKFPAAKSLPVQQRSTDKGELVF